MKGIRETYLGRWLGDALRIFNLELRNILHDGGVMIIFVVAGFLYPILYNFVYRNGILEETPIAVVDDAACSDSRRMIREMDATREMDIAWRCADMEEAKALLRFRRPPGGEGDSDLQHLRRHEQLPLLQEPPHGLGVRDAA